MKGTTVYISAGVCGFAMIAGAAHAQSQAPAGVQATTAAEAPVEVVDSGQLEDIVVTAQKRSESLQGVPIAITALTAQALETAGIQTTTELAAVTPGLSINTTAGGNILPRIRGVGQTASTITLENPVAIYVDGVYFASAAGGIFSLNSINQIAVLKGPQGTLFGRNATGGLIQVTTRDPSATLGGEIEATVGNRDIVGGNLYLTGGLADGVASDISIQYLDQGDGFGTNRFTGNDVNKARSFTARSKTLARLGDTTTLTLIGDYSRIRASAPAFKIEGVPAVPTSYPADLGKFDVYSNRDPRSIVRQYGFSAKVEQEFDFATLTSITAYRNTATDVSLDTDAGQREIAGVSAGGHERMISQELQLVSTAKGPFQWTLGGFYFNNRGHYNPRLRVVQANGAVDLLVDANPRVESFSAYVQGTYAVTDHLNATAGLRFTNEERRTFGSSTLTLSPPITPVPLTTVTRDDKTLKDNRLTWRLSLDYRASDTLLLYSSYNRGFKSGGFNPTEIPFARYEPEVVDAYEAGFKFDALGRRFRVNPSAYYYDYKNLQVGIFQEGLLRTRNAAVATIYGVDVDMVFRVTDNFTLTGGGAWTHARYDEFNGAQISTPRPLSQGGGNTVTSGSAAGNRVVNTPDWTVNIGAEYGIEIGNDKLTLSGNYYYNDGFYSEAENRQRQKAYDLVNLTASYLIDDKYKISVWGKNITNTGYALQVVTSTFGDSVARSAGRTYGATVGVSF